MTKINFKLDRTVFSKAVKPSLAHCDFDQLREVRRILEAVEGGNPGGAEFTLKNSQFGEFSIADGTLLFEVKQEALLEKEVLTHLVAQTSPALRAELDRQAFALLAAPKGNAAALKGLVRAAVGTNDIYQAALAALDWNLSRDEVRTIKTRVCDLLLEGRNGAVPMPKCVRRTIVGNGTGLQLELSVEETRGGDLISWLAGALDAKQLAVVDQKVLKAAVRPAVNHGEVGLPAAAPSLVGAIKK